MSSTCQARGRANTGLNQRAPKPSVVNHRPLDVVLDDEEDTAEWLRTAEVLAAITGSARAVQGCNSIALGQLRYTAVASPAFVRRYFAAGISAGSLAVAPRLTFNRKDRLQTQWMRLVCRRQLDTPTHWLPSTRLSSMPVSPASAGA
jgi:LysR family transcriptional regulator, chromosome initiation inhibitor